MKSSTATARIKELIDEGYVWEPPEKQRSMSGVMVRTLAITERKQGAEPLDRVQIEVELTIDCNGNYGARASVVGAALADGSSVPIMRKRITVTAPHPGTYSKPSDDDAPTVSVLRPGEKRSGADYTIDGDYSIID